MYDLVKIKNHLCHSEISLDLGATEKQSLGIGEVVINKCRMAKMVNVVLMNCDYLLPIRMEGHYKITIILALLKGDEHWK